MMAFIFLLTTVALYYLGRYDLPRDLGWNWVRRRPRNKSRWLKLERMWIPSELET